MRYRLEQRIHTLAKIAIDSTETGQYGFPVEDVTFSNWQTGDNDGYWTHDYWLATSEMEAADYIAAWRCFMKSIVRIVSRMTLASQCYMEHLAQPTLIKRIDSDVAFIWWVLDRKPGGLMFMDDERRALHLLLSSPKTPRAFFYYWRVRGKHFRLFIETTAHALGSGSAYLCPLWRA